MASHMRAVVGIQGDKAKVDRHTAGDKPLNQATLGTIHEFGATIGRSKIPARSFLRSTLQKNLRLYQKLGLESLTEAMLGKTTIATALGRFGAKVAADIRATIVAGIQPPLSEYTMSLRYPKAEKAWRKRKNKQEGPAKVTPLIDTGQLLGSIDYQVRPAPSASGVLDVMTGGTGAGKP
jgi:phage gpG-like protein